MKADARAKGLLEANGNSKFWKGISRDGKSSGPNVLHMESFIYGGI